MGKAIIWFQFPTTERAFWTMFFDTHIEPMREVEQVTTAYFFTEDHDLSDHQFFRVKSNAGDKILIPRHLLLCIIEIPQGKDPVGFVNGLKKAASTKEQNSA